MADNKYIAKPTQEPKVEQPKVVELMVVEAEENAAIVKVDGWQMRAYFDKSLSQNDKDKIAHGRVIKVEYLGDINDVHSVRILPLKSV